MTRVKIIVLQFHDRSIFRHNKIVVYIWYHSKIKSRYVHCTFHEICNWWVHQSFLISEKSYLNNSNRIFRFTISANEASISWKRAIALISESEKCHLNKRLAFFFVHKLSILDTDDVWYRKQEKFFQLQRGKFFWY